MTPPQAPVRWPGQAAGSGGTRVVLGPVSAGDAEMARQLADYLGLNDRGLLKIEPAV